MLRRFAECRDDLALSAALGSGASDVAELYPDLRERLPGLKTPEPLADAGQARFRLFDAIAELWRRAAAIQPLLLIFEDLHWADVPSLRLLEFVASGAAGSRILLTATFRDTELSREHPLLAVVGELRRKSIVQQLALTGLTTAETARLIHAATGSTPPDSATAFVQAKTAGNPLFVTAMAAYLVKEGLLTAPALSRLDREHALWRVPESIRAFVATRLERLSTNSKHVLQCGAVIGTRFGFNLLRVLTGSLSEAQVLDALGEALATHVIEERAERGCYEFDHVLTRDTLYEELPPLERARLHERVAASLERDHPHNLSPYLSQLAYHFNAALPGGSCAKAVAYATRAGEQARARLAYEEAVRWFGLALSALDQTGSVDPRLHCKLAVALGSAQMKSGESMQAVETLADAAMRAHHIRATSDLKEAAIEFEEGAWRLALPGARATQLIQNALDQLDEADEAGRAKLQSSLVRALVFADMPEQARSLHRDTVRLARQGRDPESLQAALRSGFWLRWEPAHLEELLATADEAITLARQIGNQERVLDGAAFRLNLLIAVGDLDGFSRDLEDFARLAAELRQPFHQYHAIAMRAARALFVGHFAEAEQLACEAATQGARVPGLDSSGTFGMQMFTIAQERDELPQLAPFVKQFVQSTPSSGTWRPALALVLAELGEREQARAELDRLAPAEFRAVARDSLWPACLAYLAQACALVRDLTLAEELYALLLPWTRHNLVAGSVVVCYGPADRLLGVLSTLLRRWDSAARHFDAAVEMTTRQGSMPWLAHTQNDYAGMLVERNQPGDLQRAHSLLTSAISMAEQLGMAKVRRSASQLASSLGRGAQRPSYPGGLSRREAEVLRLIAAGKSNQEIAARIFRSQNTVANHVRNILAKLGASNRTEAATFAARHGLL